MYYLHQKLFPDQLCNHFLSSGTPQISITIDLPFVSRYFCRSTMVRGWWNTPKERQCSQFPSQKLPKSWQEWHFVLPENRGIIFQQRRNLPETLPARNLPSRVSDTCCVPWSSCQAKCQEIIHATPTEVMGGLLIS